MTDWQIDQLACECVVHRYHVAHICACGELVSHSQGDWDWHRFHGGMLDFPSGEWRHGWTAAEMFEQLCMMGTVDYENSAFQILWEYFAD